MKKITEEKLQQIVSLYFDGYSTAEAIKITNKKDTRQSVQK
ncbi:hypothetical protein [Clostridium estertheticum]|nr:hypothetical protein [Clostridium estertheticum]